MVADPAEGMSSTVLPLVGDGIGNEICNAQMLEKSKIGLAGGEFIILDLCQMLIKMKFVTTLRI